MSKFNRKTSEEKPEWSSSTKVDHERVLTNTIDRKGSTTHSESDNEPKSASQLKAKWEGRATGGEKQRRESRTRAFGGSTGNIIVLFLRVDENIMTFTMCSFKALFTLIKPQA